MQQTLANTNKRFAFVIKTNTVMYLKEKQTQQTLNITKVNKYNIGGNMRAYTYSVHLPAHV